MLLEHTQIKHKEIILEVSSNMYTIVTTGKSIESCGLFSIVERASMSFNVFISYSTKDMQFVEQVRQMLTSVSINVFVSECSVLPGQSLSSEIISSIKSCDLFVLLWSKNSQSSEWVSQEIGIAKAVEKPIIPLMLEPGLELPGFIRDIKYLSILDEPEKSLVWLQQHILDHKQNKETINFWGALMVIGALYFIFRK